MADQLLQTVTALVERAAAADEERDKMLIKAALLAEEIEKLRHAIFGLATLIQPETKLQKLKETYPQVFKNIAEAGLGVTDAIREVLKKAGKYMTPVEIRDAAIKISPALQGHKSPVSTVNTILKRLVDANEVSWGVYETDGQSVYGWAADEAARKILAPHLEIAEEREDFINPPKNKPIKKRIKVEKD